MACEAARRNMSTPLNKLKDVRSLIPVGSFDPMFLENLPCNP